MLLTVNLSTLFCEVPLLERFELARLAGFDEVEIQFPYDENLDDLSRALDACKLPLTLINLPAGDIGKGDMGLGAISSRQAEFKQAVELSLDFAKRLGAKKINILSGRVSENSKDANFETYAKNLQYAGDKFGAEGVSVLVEPVNQFDRPEFFLHGLKNGVKAVEMTNHENVSLLFDLYHMAKTERSLNEAIRTAGPFIGHVQFADTPGRHEPGTGTINFEDAIKMLHTVGYQGAVSAEYFPKTNSAQSLSWMGKFRRLMTQ